MVNRVYVWVVSNWGGPPKLSLPRASKMLRPGLHGVQALNLYASMYCEGTSVASSTSVLNDVVASKYDVLLKESVYLVNIDFWHERKTKFWSLKRHIPLVTLL